MNNLCENNLQDLFVLLMLTVINVLHLLHLSVQ